MLPFPASFEFFPPKTEEGTKQFLETAQQLNHHHPSFFSVTFGAGGSSRQGTLDALQLLQCKTPIPVAAHLACIGLSKKNLLDILQCYKNMGIKHLVALRGDLPFDKQMNDGEFAFAVDLVTFIKTHMGSHFKIEVAAYPEFHPEAKKVKEDILNLKRKYEAGADGAITQYFFSADAYFYFLEDCEHQGIRMPIVPGIMPITHFEKLTRFSSVCGAEIPRWIAKRLESYGDDIQSLKQFGIEIIYHLCEQLIAGGAPGLHFYTLNQAEASMTLCELLLSQRQEIIPRKAAG